MGYRTTTNRVFKLFESNTAEITQIITCNKDKYKGTAVDKNTFMENLEFLAETGCIIDCIGWYYDKPHDNIPGDEWILTTGKMNGEADDFITVHLRMIDPVAAEKILYVKGY